MLNCFNIYLYFTASIFVIGSISGALVGGITGEKLGRKSALMIDNLIMIVGKIKIIPMKVHKGKKKLIVLMRLRYRNKIKQ